MHDRLGWLLHALDSVHCLQRKQQGLRAFATMTLREYRQIQLVRQS